jgi:hypothetical protein
VYYMSTMVWCLVRHKIAFADACQTLRQGSLSYAFTPIRKIVLVFFLILGLTALLGAIAGATRLLAQ